MARISLEVGFATDVGRQRQRNEDSYAIYVPYPGEANPSGINGLLLVADGMGGERAGDRASQLASQRLRDWIASGAYRSWPEFAAEQPFEAVLRRATREISNEIYLLGEEDPSIRGLGSTLVAGVFRDDAVTIGHVGDSRCYRIRGGGIELLTTDHSWVERQVEAGVLTPEQARNHPQRNVLTRSLGDTSTPDPDLRSEPLQAGDLFILCSDGLTGKVTDAEILQQAKVHPSPQMLAEALVMLANDKDGSDNITAVVGLCHDEETRTSAEPDDTEPITRPEGMESLYAAYKRGSAWKVWLPATVVALVFGLVAGYFGLRLRSSLVFARGAAHFQQQEYPQARQQFENLLGMMLNDEDRDELIRMLAALEGPPAPERPTILTAPATPVDAGAVPEAAGDEPEAVAEPPPGDDVNSSTPAQESED